MYFDDSYMQKIFLDPKNISSISELFRVTCKSVVIQNTIFQNFILIKCMACKNKTYCYALSTPTHVYHYFTTDKKNSLIRSPPEQSFYFDLSLVVRIKRG